MIEMKPPEMPALRARAGMFLSCDAWKEQGQVRSRECSIGAGEFAEERSTKMTAVCGKLQQLEMQLYCKTAFSVV